MGWLEAVVFLLTLIYFGYICLNKIVPYIISFVLSLVLKVDISVDGIQLWRPKLKLVKIKLKRYDVLVEGVCIRSSLFNLEAKRIVSVVLEGVKVAEHPKYGSSDPSPGGGAKEIKHDKFMKILNTVVQFMSLNITNFTYVRSHKSLLVSVNLAEFSIDGSILHNMEISLNGRWTDTSVKVVNIAETQSDPAVLFMKCTMDVGVLVGSDRSFEAVDVRVSSPQMSLSESFFSSLKDEEYSPQKVREDGVHPLSMFLPKKACFEVKDLDVVLLKEASKGQCQLSSRRISFELSGLDAKSAKLASVVGSGKIMIEQISLLCSSAQILGMEALIADFKKDKYNLKCAVEARRLSSSYHHQQIHQWVAFLSTLKQPEKTNPSERHRLFNVDLTINIVDASVTCYLNNSVPLRLGVIQAKYYLKSTSEGYECTTVHDLQTETLWISMNNTSASNPTDKRQHVWGTVLCMGLLIVKVEPKKLDILADSLQIEWSPRLGAVSMKVKKFVDSLKAEVGVVKKSSELPDLLPPRVVSCVCANTNIFLISSKQVGFMIRIDSWAAERLAENFVMTMENCKGVNLEPTKPFLCTSSSEISKECLTVEKMSVQNKSGQISLDFGGALGGYWTPENHLTMFQIVTDLKEFVSGSGFGGGGASKGSKKAFVCNVKKVKLTCALTKNNVLDIVTGPSTLSIKDPTTDLNLSFGQMVFDGNPVLTVRDFHWVRADSDSDLRKERAECQRLTLRKNKSVVAEIGSFHFSFPHGYNFAEVFSEHFMGLNKWLRKIHRSGSGKTPFTAESPLPRDLRIKVANFSLELADDPFEIKLRANYELLEDEHKESLKRRKALDAKIEELKKTHPGLPQAKIEELYKNMTRKDAEVYIQRHRQLFGRTPPKTPLFKWLISDIEIFAMADPCLHGKERALAAIREIDPDSPWPDDGLEFNVLWCREIRFGCSSWRFQLRDFPQPLVAIRKLMVIGRLAGAEMEAAPRAKRTYQVLIEEPWQSDTIERSLTSLKYYHDFKCLFERLCVAYGPCWEPVIAQCNLAFERVNRPSRDPSPSLPFWDKMRLMYHGRITSSIHQMTILLHTSLDPYNTTEEMEVTWTGLIMDWTNCNFLFRGDFNIYVRTASKYDDCRLLQLPNLKLNIALQWLCLGDPHDHHSIMPCAPDKVPEYSSNQDHDSYRAFRSQNVIMSVSMETKARAGHPDLRPIALLYGSTLKWFENLKYILTGVSRPIRRGKLFKNIRKRKPNLSRHYKSIRLSLSLHRFDVCYWMSFSMQRGFEFKCGRLMLSSEHNLVLVQHDDGLKHRPRAEWFISYMNCELNDGEVYLQTALKGEDDPPVKIVINKPIEKRYFASVSKMSYGREVSVSSAVSYISGGGKNLPTHRLVVHDMKSAWTKSNREIVFALYDSLVKAKMLKENLSPDVMNVFRTETNPSPMKPRGRNTLDPAMNLGSPLPPPGISTATIAATPSPMSRLQSGHAAGMLQKLIAEAESRAVVFSEDLPPTDSNQPALQGIAACQADDVLHTNWLIELVNSQVLLKGCETKGYLILSAAKAQLLNRVHQPVWKDQTLVSKTSWVCILEGLQYYATVSPGNKDDLETIMWLSVEHIGEKEIAEIPDMVGSGQSVGGVVSETVGPSNDPDNTPLQLQRIVARCKCEIFYVCYGDDNLDPAMLEDCYIPPPPSDDVSDIWTKRERAVDSFTLTHHDLNICTNSLQYAMVLDVINNLILYVEPHRKESMEKRQRLRFQLQLSNIEDQKKPIQQLQNQLSLLVSQLRRLEKETFFVNKALWEDQTDEKLIKESEALEKQDNECKERLNSVNEELAMLISCVQEAQLSANQKRFSRQSGGLVSLVRTQEICFKHAQWRLTETDGQLGIADLVLSNFLYTNNSRSDDSVEHTLELGYMSVTNLLPNQAYKEVLFPTNLNRNMPFDRLMALRVFSRDRAPVGGICIKEHFEINVVPLTIALTHQFFKTMMNFCFPEKDRELDDDESEPQPIRGSTNRLQKVGSSNQLSKSGSSNQSASKAVATPSGKRGSSFYIPMESDVEKMKQRAEQNKLFIYIKIPEVPVRVSYKGLKEKNMMDIHEFSLVIPTLEYHNVTWTWLDLFIAMKNDTKKVLLSQAIKQKLQIRSRVTLTEEQSVTQEEDKARLLFGSKLVPGESKSGKRSLFKSLKPN